MPANDNNQALVATETVAEDKSAVINSKTGSTRRASAVTRLFGHYMARTSNPQATLIISVLKLDKDPSATPNEMRDVLWERIIKMGKFRSQLVVHRLGGYWKELSMQRMLELRDTGYLWSEVFPEGQATPEDIDSLVSQVWQYDAALPLWRVQYCRKAKDGSAYLIFTINHAIGDGMALVATLFGLSDQPPDLTKTPNQLAKEARQRSTYIFFHSLTNTIHSCE